jgi:integrase
MRRGFIGLAQQNQELVKLNKELTLQLKTVVEELNQLKKERHKKAARKEARANRKRLPKRDPMTPEIYKELIKESEGPTYLHVRLRLALCLLVVTGVRINELLNIKVSQLKTLTQESWIAIDRSKRGPSNHKAFLTKEGKKIIQDRKKDFQFILLIKEPDAYVFTSEANHYQKLRHEGITKDVNKVMRSVSKQLPGQPNVTSHSFRIGYITQLWKDSKDIEFVKRSIGHRTLDTTSAYVDKLSDQERQERMSELDSLSEALKISLKGP